MNKQNILYTYNVAIKRNEILINVITWMNPENSMQSERKTDTKGHGPLRDFTYMRCPEQANPQRQNIDQWLPGPGVEGNRE